MSIVGLLLGMFGGGGSLLALPVLVYAAGATPASAVVASLLVVGITSAVATHSHYRRGHVRLGTALWFGGAGASSAYFAAPLTQRIPERYLLLLIAAVMVLAGASMYLRRAPAERPLESAGPKPVRLVPTLLAGAAVGGATGLLGVGGGFLIVPALLAFTGLGLREAIGTSLFVISLNSAAGLLGHLGQGMPHLAEVAALSLAATLGALLGGRAAQRVSVSRLRAGFAMLVMGVGVALAISSGLALRS